MKNVTLSAEDHLIEQAREVVRAAEEFDALMKRLSYVRAGRKFTRDEMNER
jgi:hypothetical protein